MIQETNLTTSTLIVNLKRRKLEAADTEKAKYMNYFFTLHYFSPGKRTNILTYSMFGKFYFGSPLAYHLQL